MAFLPEFETDIFISYARVDNKTATGGEGWVALFIKHLQTELDKLHGRMGEVKLWWDPTLDDNQLFDVKIQHQINGSAIFLALTSNGYLRSEYCRKELRWFREQAEQNHGLKIGDRLRVVNVMLNNIPPKDWPDEFQGAIGSKFHDADREDELGQPPLPGETLFREKLRKLSESIFRTLKQFKDAAEPQPVPEPVNDDSFLVFLADVSETLQTRRDLVANELRQKGVRLIADIPPPDEPAAHDNKVKTEIARADLSVHLLNEWGGRRMDRNSSSTYPRRQVELGLQHAKSQLIWVPQSLNSTGIKEIEDATQRDLLTRLENDDREQSRYRFLCESPSAIAREVINQLEELKRQQTKTQTESNAALIDTHSKDQLHAWELGRVLTANNISPLINPPVDDPALSLRLLEDRLRQVSRLIILFGEASEEWVRARLGEALRVAARTPGCPLREIAICFVPPQRKEKGIRFNFNFMPVQSFNLCELLNPQIIESFLVEPKLNNSTSEIDVHSFFCGAVEASQLPFLNPFVGLRTFHTEESLLFFGRNEQTIELLQQLHKTRFLAIVGNSGCGKSSLIRAGLIPKLKAGFLVEDRDRWLTATMKPGDSPLRNLAAALLKAAFGDTNEAMIDNFVKNIRQLGADYVTTRLAATLGDSSSNLLLLIDQFEEIFRFGVESNKADQREEAEDFVNLMLALTEQRALPIYVVMTMRSDFIGDCDNFYGLPEAMNSSQYLVPRLTRHQRQQAIEGPIRLFGATITPRCLNRVLNDVGDESDQLPVMQHALMRTWEERTRVKEIRKQEDEAVGNKTTSVDVQHYEAVGTIKDVLSRDANSALEKMSVEEVKITERMFMALIEIGGNDLHTRRPVTLEKLCAVTRAESGTVLRLVRIFNDNQRSFLTLSNNKGNPLIDISHESLIRLWEKLGQWIEAERTSLKVYQRLANTANRKEQTTETLYNGKDLYEALIWRKDREPNSDWAANYDRELDLDYNKAISFLERSIYNAKSKIKKQRKVGILTLVIFRIPLYLFTFLIIVAWMLTAYARSEDPNLTYGVLPFDETIWRWILRVSTSMVYFMVDDVLHHLRNILIRWSVLSPELRFFSMLAFILLLVNLIFTLRKRKQRLLAKVQASDESLLSELSKLVSD